MQEALSRDTTQITSQPTEEYPPVDWRKLYEEDAIRLSKVIISCRVCGTYAKPMAFQLDPYCSDNHRKELGLDGKR